MSKSAECARAAARALSDVPNQLAALEEMSHLELAEKHRELYGEPTRSRHRGYLKKRLAWRVQELAEGGLPQSALAKIAELGDGLPQRWRMREAAQAAQATPAARAQVVAFPPSRPRDPRLPSAGTVLRRIHKGVVHEVVVGLDSFEYAGERFKTLSAVARRIAGAGWNGYLFFGLTKKAAGPTPKTVAAPPPSALAAHPAHREVQP